MNGLTPYGARVRPQAGPDLWIWLFMRISGVLLIFLVLGHLWVMHVWITVERLSAELVRARLQEPFWVVYDWLLLMLALLHGMLGVRYVITDYIREPRRRLFCLVVVWLITGLLLFLGTMVFFWVRA